LGYNDLDINGLSRNPTTNAFIPFGNINSVITINNLTGLTDEQRENFNFNDIDRIRTLLNAHSPTAGAFFDHINGRLILPNTTTAVTAFNTTPRPQGTYTLTRPSPSSLPIIDNVTTTRTTVPGPLLGKEFDMENQDYQYEFATRTFVTINALAKNVYTDKMYADLKSIIDFTLSLTTSDPKVLEAFYRDPPNNLAGLDLANAVDEHLASENAKMNAALYDRFNNMLYLVDRHAENAIREQTQLGARGRRLELLQSRLEQDSDSYLELLSNNEDTNMIMAIIQKAAAEAAFAASLRASANIVQLSLANFIG
jgi:flagellin-like hook-associated protein FlgL